MYLKAQADVKVKKHCLAQRASFSIYHCGGNWEDRFTRRTRMNASAHQEKHFQRYIVERLVEQGWKLGDTKHYDTERALYPEDLEAWIKLAAKRISGRSWSG